MVSGFQQFVDLGGTDEIVVGQAIDGVCGVTHFAITIPCRKVRVMTLLFGQVGHGIDKRNGLEEIFELQGSGNALLVRRQLPARYFIQLLR